MHMLMCRFRSFGFRACSTATYQSSNDFVCCCLSQPASLLPASMLNIPDCCPASECSSGPLQPISPRNHRLKFQVANCVINHAVAYNDMCRYLWFAVQGPFHLPSVPLHRHSAADHLSQELHQHVSPHTGTLTHWPSDRVDEAWLVGLGTGVRA